MSEHTKGPWEAQILENSAPYITARRHGDEVGHDCVASVNPQNQGSSTANARLIATAPEMLEALKAIASGSPKRLGPKQLEILIAKAEGKHE